MFTRILYCLIFVFCTTACESEPQPPIDQSDFGIADAQETTDADVGDVVVIDMGDDAGEGADADAGEMTDADAGEVMDADAGEVMDADAGEVMDADAGDIIDIDGGEPGDAAGGDADVIFDADMGPTDTDFGAPDADAGEIGDADAGEIGDADAQVTDVDVDGGMGDADIGDLGESPKPLIIGGDRPVEVVIPSTYDGSPTPLVLSLHSYTSSAASQEIYLRLGDRVDSRGFILVTPDGTSEPFGEFNQFWDATPACCNFTGVPVDDVSYLLGLVDEVESSLNIDPRRIFIVGYSNGGFMAHRLICELETKGRFAAIATLAGVTHLDEMDCLATDLVSVLHIHGTLDDVIQFDGGFFGPEAHPSAEETIYRRAFRASCIGEPDMDDPIDIEEDLPGAETDVFNFRNGCIEGIGVSFWRINGGGHLPEITSDFTDRVLDFLFAHPKL